MCGEPLGDSPWFSRDGVCRCASCAERLGAPGYVRLIPATFSAVRHILTQELPRVYAFALSGPARVQLAQVCEAYALCRAERGFDSCDILPLSGTGGRDFTYIWSKDNEPIGRKIT